ncbi:phage head-binding domain-containing protein [Xenorhabdus bovienii]|uniref:phage head-binding domain-containing protein n=1 Tax=Xenorhabdus bovienii TaxID=40576 RepID=UPI001EE0C135|nr:phage head-binding domain-containing protein [Xenorhabdus bovienii]MCG3463461.1 phage head-binding domain-containing protein [Xenorhabdus bovienii]
MSEIIPNVVVSMPSQLFTMARSFKACSNGRIYIGKIDTDPTILGNQIQIYLEREDGARIPASQPIIINAAGFPVYAGQIAKFVTVKGHSMAVYDSYGVQQHYFPNILKYDPDRFSERLGEVGGDKLVGSSHGGTVYSDYTVSVFRKVGDFKSGSKVKSKFECLLLNGMYYSYKLDEEHTVTEHENVERDWICVGLLNGHPENNIKNFGAKDDLVQKGSDATDCSEAWELCYLFCIHYGYAMILPDSPIYVTKPCKAGNLSITSESGVAGFADPYYGRDKNGKNFINGTKSANWTYFYNYDIGISKSWFDMVKIAYGCLVCSDRDISILIKGYHEEFKLNGIGVLGNHREKNQIGVDSGIAETYEGTRSEIDNVSVIGCGSHGILFRDGIEASSFNNLNLHANNGYGMYIDAHNDIDSPSDYFTVTRVKANHNRLGGIGFKHIRVMLVCEDIIGNNSGQYDSPFTVDPLLGYYRNITPTNYDYRVALISIENGTLNEVGDLGSIHNLTFRNIKGEQVVNLISIRNRTAEIGTITKVTLDNIHAIESSKLNDNLKGCIALIDCTYLEDVQANNVYATQHIVKLEIDNIDSFKNGSGTTNIPLKTIKQKALFKKSGTLIESGKTTGRKLVNFTTAQTNNTSANSDNPENHYRITAVNFEQVGFVDIYMIKVGSAFIPRIVSGNSGNIILSPAINYAGNISATIEANCSYYLTWV